MRPDLLAPAYGGRADSKSEVGDDLLYLSVSELLHMAELNYEDVRPTSSVLGMFSTCRV